HRICLPSMPAGLSRRARSISPRAGFVNAAGCRNARRAASNEAEVDRLRPTLLVERKFLVRAAAFNKAQAKMCRPAVRVLRDPAMAMMNALIQNGIPNSHSDR